MLTEYQQKLWEEYLEQEKIGTRTYRDDCLERFILSIENIDEDQRNEWALSLCNKIVNGHQDIPVRMSFFERILFPALLTGILNREPGCALWVTFFWDRLLNCQECINQLKRLGLDIFGYRQFLELSITYYPYDANIRNKLIDLLARDLQFSIHEVPDGILYAGSSDSVSTQEFVELENDLDLFQQYVKQAEVEDKYEYLIELCHTYFSAYRKYNGKRSEFATFQSYLDFHGIKYPPEIPIWHFFKSF